MSVSLLVLAFFLTALLYSSVGFGGGSTYNALLILAAVPLALVPVIALACNIAVVAIGSAHFGSNGHIEWRRFWPLALLSVPAAWIGGYLQVPTWLFVGMLALALVSAGGLMLWQPLWKDQSQRGRGNSRNADIVSGGALGLLAGVTGIGGGIYLSPLLHLRRWDRSQAIAGTCALFILVNSLAGLAGQIAKSGLDGSAATFAAYWPLLPAVVLGGLAGAGIGAGRLKETHLRVVTALLIVYVGVRLGFRFPAEWAKA